MNSEETRERVTDLPSIVPWNIAFSSRHTVILIQLDNQSFYKDLYEFSRYFVCKEGKKEKRSKKKEEEEKKKIDSTKVEILRKFETSCEISWITSYIAMYVTPSFVDSDLAILVWAENTVHKGTFHLYIYHKKFLSWFETLFLSIDVAPTTKELIRACFGSKVYVLLYIRYYGIFYRQRNFSLTNNFASVLNKIIGVIVTN